MKVVALCDSDDGKAWTRSVRAVGLDPSVIAGGRLALLADGLVGRQVGRTPDSELLHLVDHADVLIIGSDVGAVFCGERLAYLARCYSACKAIVLVDGYPPGFDLAMTGHPRSFADVHVSSADLRNPRLWRSPAKPGFRPWNWPVLTDLVAKFKRRVEFLSTRMDRPMLADLGFGTQEHVDRFPREVAAFLSYELGYDDLRMLTFREFVLRSGNGLRVVDAERGCPDVNLHRIAAAKVSRWLEDFVLAGQEILVDAPHLVSRVLSVFRGAATLSNLAKTTTATTSTSPIGIARALGLRPEVVKSMINPIWTSRPAWIWSETQKLRDNFEWRDFPRDFVFCEDVSAFRRLGMAKYVVTAVCSGNVRRFVSASKQEWCWPEVRFNV